MKLLFNYFKEREVLTCGPWTDVKFLHTDGKTKAEAVEDVEDVLHHELAPAAFR